MHFLLLCFGLYALGTFAPVHARRVIRATPGVATTGCYIVKLNDSVTHDQFEAALQEVAPLASESKVYEKVEGDVAKIFTMKLSHEAAEKVKNLDNVEYVEEETYATSSQLCSDFSWGLDRIDQVSSVLNCRYNPGDKGEGSDIYILDTGINYDHEEFENRAKYPGRDPTDDFDRRGVRQRGSDCDGHGTHVASLAAGKTRGSAPKAIVYSVRVLDCSGSGAWSVIVNGINYAVEQIKAKRRPAVISMSLGGDASRTVDDAISRTYSMGVPVVVAAGNEQDDACDYSPSRSQYAITVGGTARGDVLYSFSNGGSCVDIFAPGQSIPGADYNCNSCSISFSGTSMATPFVSGVVAILLQRQSRLTPQQVKNKLISDALKNVINFRRFNRNLRSSSPNRFLHINSPPATTLPTTAPPTTAPPATAPPSTAPPTTAPPSTAPPTTAPPATAPPSTVPPTTAPPSTAPPSTAPPSTAPPTTALPTTDSPTMPPSDCSLTDLMDSFREEMSQEMKTLILQGMNYMAYLVNRKCNISTDFVVPRNIITMGMRKESPADSCQILNSFKPFLQSGLYWIKNATRSSVHVYCDMEREFLADESRGWVRIANLDMTDPNATCPGELRLVNQVKRSCGRGQQDPGCSSAFFSTQGIQYSKVCGRVRGYQHSTPNAFFWYTRSSRPLTIDDYYVDGVSLTHSSVSGRNHIWTFAAALDEVVRRRPFACPCTNPNSSATFEIPPFVGNDYFCETGSRNNYQYQRFYHEDPLWDGAGCGPASTCCQTGPLFCKTLPHATTDNIELRVCANERRDNEDTPLDQVELYIQ